MMRRDRVQFVRPAHLTGLELVSACYSSRSFPVHSHPEYVVGTVVEGAERLVIGGRDLTIRCGDSLLIHPDEAHANSSIDGVRMGYRVFYIPTALVTRTIGSLSFEKTVSSAARLFECLTAAHHALSQSADALEQDSIFLSLAAELARTGRRTRPLHPAPRAKLRQAREYLEAHFCDGMRLEALAEIAGLSPFHLLRSFRRQYGITPAAYCSQLRVMEARHLLKAGQPIAEVAAHVGFADQSHLTRHFQRVMGTTPGRYAQQ